MRRCVSFHVLLGFEMEFRHHLPVVSGYTLSFPGRVSGEQRGGAAEISSRIREEHEN
jgi:hypothetical protein